jgi:hypothetical protein
MKDEKENVEVGTMNDEPEALASVPRSSFRVHRSFSSLIPHPSSLISLGEQTGGS